jgi:hypothetical protein
MDYYICKSVGTVQNSKNKQIMKSNKDRTIIASYVNDERDGIGIEVYRDNKLVIEIFRDDTKKTRTVTLWEQDLPLELIEESIKTFKKEISWNFID